MKVPLLDLKAQYAALRDEIQPVIETVCDSQYFILGPQVQGFEEEIAAYCDTRHAVGVSSGTDALIVSLMACDIGSGDEVITTPFTFFGTVGSIARVGAKPVFVDSCPTCFNIDPAKIEAAITEHTKAIMPVDLFGQMADMRRIMEIARKHDLIVIEDSAQSIGAAHHGKKTGQYAHLTTFSFFPSKNLGGFGDGGMVVTDDAELAQKCRVLRMHGETKRYHHSFIGGNFRLDALQAAILRVKLRHLDGWSAKRRENAAYYDEKFVDTPVVTPTVYDYNKSIYNQYTIMIPKGRRDQVQAHLTELGVGCAVYYPIPLHLQECFAYLNHKPGDFPSSEVAAGEVLSLPIYPELTDAQKNAVVAAVTKACG
ncbi:MAG: DegT/DnrJ/EryC1/StrS family aminotransferase [Phycisphaerae bacterium]|nr:DegT/DnrJ/EryC1/StrS family aminotransferase [Phycisphaerae bacterium]